MDGSGRGSPLKPRIAKQDVTRLTGRKLTPSSSTDDSSKPHPQARIRAPQHKAAELGRSGTLPPDIPRRTRSNPSYSANPPTTRHTHLTTSQPLKSSETLLMQQSRQPVPRRPVVQHSQSLPAPQLDQAKQRLVDRAIKARLYYLRRTGPNRFLIGGDSPDSRFHVTIGPQSCSCNKSPCIHILFVMLRVFKLPQNDPNLWRKPLLNYEAEGLLTNFQTRVSQRNTPRRASKKSVEKVGSVDSPTLPASTRQTPLTEMPILESLMSVDESTAVADPPPMTAKIPVKSEGGEDATCEAGEGARGEGVEIDKSDGEEEVCPICLNELDEGEDLLTCSNGCQNQLHQHCMDVWAGEQRQKSEDVYCPVCRAPWSYRSPSALTSPPAPGAEGSCLITKFGSPNNVVLSKDKQQLYDQLKSMFGEGAAEDLFSPDWKHREAALALISRESISYLLPLVTAKFQSRPDPGVGGASAHSVQEVCMKVVAHTAHDVVLKVFLAALELLRVVLGYSLCHNAFEANKLQQLLLPVLPVLITRCGDAQRRVKECSIETACNLCLGQEGPLSVGSCCGHQASCGVSNVRLVLTVALNDAQNHAHSWNWWLGRLTLIDKLITRFSWEYLLPQCMLKPLSLHPPSFDSDSDESHSGTMSDVMSVDSLTSNLSAMAVEASSPESGSREASLKSDHLDAVVLESRATNTGVDSMSPVVKNNLLMQCWYFAAKATHVAHNKVSKIASKVIVRIAKILRDDPSSLEIIHDVISKCHRTTADGLLDKVLSAREKPQESMIPRKKDSITHPVRRSLKPRKLHNPDQPIVATQALLGDELQPKSLSQELSEEDNFGSKIDSIDVEKSLSLLVPRLQTSSPSRSRDHSNPTGPIPITHSEAMVESDEDDLASEDSFHSATSKLDQTLMEEQIILERDKSSEGTEEGSSSTSTSHDSRSGDRQLRGDNYGSIASGGMMGSGVSLGDIKTSLNIMREHPYYKRQSTVDSAIGTEFDSSLESASTTRAVFPCKANIEEEEAERLAKVRSMVPEDTPHPSLSNLVPPTEETLVYMQNTVGRSESEGTDGYSIKPYIEGVHWKKGKVIGTGAFCTCHLARDLENGTMFAVKQVSYVRNTKDQEEEELARLREEIAMLGRLSHPNIVRCLGATQQDGHVNIFVEWMAGGCLDNILSEFGPLKESVICNYTKQICLGIAYLHDNHVLHRDLKGGNILLDSTGRRIRIADFGSSARLAANTTGPGEFQGMEGTVAFMAPEVVRGGTYEDSTQPIGYGRKCDVWSIGCVVIQMVTAKAPWAGTYDPRNKFQLIFKIGQTTSPPPLPSFSNPALKDLTIRCLEVNPSDRPTSSELLKHALFSESLIDSK